MAALGALTLFAAGRIAPSPHLERKYVFLAAVLLLLDSALHPRLGPTPQWPYAAQALLFGQLAWSAILAYWLVAGTRRRLGGGFVAAIAVTAALTSTILILATPDPNVDLYRLHVAGADALWSGENPYTDISVQEDYRPDNTITGYVYPPVSLLSFAVPAGLGIDARMGAVVAWTTGIAILGRAALRNPQRDYAIGLLLLVAAQPGLPGILTLAWTETIALPWLTLGAVLLFRRPLVAGLSLGIGLASKQYYLVIAAVLLLMSDPHRKLRLATVAVVAVATVIPFALLSPTGVFDATVGHLSSLPVRFDTANAIGLLFDEGSTFAVPKWLGPALAVIIGGLTGRKARTPALFAAALGLTLSVTFFFGTQALESYWFLVAWLAATSLILETETSKHTSVSRTQV
jgi:hypothetical protein